MRFQLNNGQSTSTEESFQNGNVREYVGRPEATSTDCKYLLG